MRGIYRKRFSSTDLKHLWDRDGEEVDLIALYGGMFYHATFADGTGASLFADEVEVLPET